MYGSFNTYSRKEDMPITKAMSSPLRYPGGKAFLVDYVANLLRENYLDLCTFIEPYAGSAVVSIELLHQGLVNNVVLIERDPLIYAFWKSVFQCPYELIERIQNLPITIDTWTKFQKYRFADSPFDYPLAEMGTAGFFFNRTTFSGIMKAGPLGGLAQISQYKIDCRFNKDRLIQQIYKISHLHHKIEVCFDDAIKYLRTNRRWLRRENCFLYIDPPYYQKGAQLYRYWYNYNDHEQLACFLLKLEAPWLVSYDNHEAIRKLYKNANGLQEIYTDYSTSTRRREQELLFSNLHIPPFIEQQLRLLTA